MMKQSENKYRDPARVKKLTERIREVAHSIDQPIRLMEVCGTHTHSIFHFGIRDLLPENVQLISGPGCPVCVTPMEYIDQAILLSRQPEVVLTTFGDLMRVPGKLGSLSQAKAEGIRVEILYSPLDSLELARKNPDKLVVFLAVGFETTTPLTALAVHQAQTEGIENFAILNAHKVVPPALRLLTTQELELNGFLLPGHVSAIIGEEPYQFLADEVGIPGVIAGFEPVDILHGVLRILEQLTAEEAKIENVYSRVVRREGNPRAIEMIQSYFEPIVSEWRGLGEISESGLTLQSEWRGYEVLAREDLELVQRVKGGMAELKSQSSVKEVGLCICGLILTGRKTPLDCPSFGGKCNPTSPLGACMVSSEGTCAAYYRYQRRGGKSLVR